MRGHHQTQTPNPPPQPDTNQGGNGHAPVGAVLRRTLPPPHWASAVIRSRRAARRRAAGRSGWRARAWLRLYHDAGGSGERWRNASSTTASKRRSPLRKNNCPDAPPARHQFRALAEDRACCRSRLVVEKWIGAKSHSPRLAAESPPRTADGDRGARPSRQRQRAVTNRGRCSGCRRDEIRHTHMRREQLTSASLPAGIWSDSASIFRKPSPARTM